MENDEIKKLALYDLKDRVCEIRGTIIEECCFIERLVYNIIRLSSFDSKEDFDFIIDLFTNNGKIMLEKQFSLLNRSLIRLKSQGVNLKDDHIHKLKDIFQDRNIMAHSMLDTSINGIEKFKKDKSFTLLVRDKKNSIKDRKHYTVDDYCGLVELINKVMPELIDINHKCMEIYRKRDL